MRHKVINYNVTGNTLFWCADVSVDFGAVVSKDCIAECCIYCTRISLAVLASLIARVIFIYVFTIG